MANPNDKYIEVEISLMAFDRHSAIKEIAELDIPVKRSAIAYAHMRDPALLRYYYNAKTMHILKSSEIVGSSPTDIFIGRFGYPKVFIGPMVPPEFGDTSLMGMPERWRPFGIEKIVEMRSKLVRGMQISSIHDVEKRGVPEFVQSLAMAEKPADAELGFAGKPFMKPEVLDEAQPFGPSAKIRDFKVYNFKADRMIESMHFDTDAKATTAINELYKKGLEVSSIQKALSAGLFGLKNSRKFVPTRWSITAVDDTISKTMREEIKGYESIDAIHAFYNVALDNRWLIFLIPGFWQYESIEAFYPKTVWNADGKSISIYGSYEGYKGRKTYAEIGGCYYSGRLATTEKLQGMKKQAMALILREVHEGYIMPVGVWNVREHVRETLETKPTILHDTAEMLQFISQKMEIKPANWIANSRLLREIIMQKRISSYI